MFFRLIINSQFALSAGAGFAILVCLYFICRYLEPKTHPLEPRYVRSHIPLIGHVLGFMRSGNQYLESFIEDEGIQSLNFGWRRAYIISSLDLTAAVQRQSATVSFFPVVKMMAVCLSHFSPEMSSLFDPDQSRTLGGKKGLAQDTLSDYHRAFGPGAGSEQLQANMLNELLRLLCAPGESSRQHQSRALYSWLKHIITHASMTSIYGPQHPFRNPAVEKAFWDFELECGPLLMNFAPHILARKAMRARDVLDRAFAKYYQSGALEEASELAWARYQPPSLYGIEPQDIGRLESPFLFAVLATSVPTCFWAFIEIHRHPGLLAEVRDELAHAIVVTDVRHDCRSNHETTKSFAVQMERLKTSCPLLLSVFQETLRRLSIFSLFRVVLKDTMLADRYLLKAGSLVMMPNNVVHNSSQIWGDRAREFDPYRFMPDRGRTPANHFRSFGEAPFRCPGRHFATTEIISILCILLMRFDSEPKQNGGDWNLPLPHLAVFGAIMPPKTDVHVSLHPREGWQGNWSFELGNPNIKFPLVTG